MSHLSDIGFTVKSREEFQAIAQKVLDKGEEINTPVGKYFLLQDGQIEMWASIPKEGEPSINPYFKGMSKRKLKLVKTEERIGMDGSYHAWVSRVNNNDEDYPMVFDVPNFYMEPVGEFPKIVTVQLTAFAEKITVYDNLEDYNAEGKKGTARLAEIHFVPIGTFNLDKSEKKPVTSGAMLGGEIIQVEQKVNTITEEKFFWMLVKTLSGEIDVVVDMNGANKTPIIGGYIAGHFWVTGKILN